MPSPLKKQLSQFKTFEKQMEKAVGAKFEIDTDMFVSSELKRADVQLLLLGVLRPFLLYNLSPFLVTRR